MIFYENRSLFSDYYLEERIDTHAEWAEDISAAFEAARALYRDKREVLAGANEAQTEAEFIRPLLREVLGFQFDVQARVTRQGRLNWPDYALFTREQDKIEAQRRRDEQEAYYARAAAVADAKFWGRPLDRKISDPRDELTNANPSFQIVNYLVATGVDWGVLTNDQRWRLYYARARSRVDTYYEVDLAQVLASGDPSTGSGQAMDAFRYFYHFFRAAAFERDPQTEQSFLEAVYEGSVNYGAELERRLKELIFKRIFIHLATGFLRTIYVRDHRRTNGSGAVETRQELDTVYQGTLRLLYRLLFLLHAEARDLLPVDDRHGYYRYSLTRLKREVAERLDRGEKLSAVSADIWCHLEGLFDIIDQGDPALDVPRYNGGLFRRDNPQNDFLNTHRIADAYLAPAFDLLTRERDPETGHHVFIDYKTLDVEQLGSIYEGLLEFHLESGETERLPKSDDETSEVSLVNDKGERKATGSYYTPHYIVAYIVEQTLGPVLEEREGRFRALMAEIEPRRKRLEEIKRKLDAEPERSDAAITRWTNERTSLRRELSELEPRAIDALLGIKVCDPAMGSGHFLVHAADWLAEHLIVVLNEFPDNPVLRQIAQIREQIVTELTRQGITIDAAQLKDTNLLKRMVMKRAIYGVDLNPMAVELTKLSLWLDSFTVGAPLSFLNHHLKVGNSLIGARVEEVREALEREGAQYHMFGGPFAGLLTATELMRGVAARTDATFDEVEESVAIYADFEEAMLPYKRVLDLWVSRYFGNAEAEHMLRIHGNDALAAVVDEEARQALPPQYQEAARKGRDLWEEKRFFHWELEFPEVFVDLESKDWQENPGFDAVIGNPPYIRSVRLKDVDPLSWKYYAQTYQTAATREFDIYLCFTEQGLKLMNQQGYCGLIIPNKWLTTRVGETLRMIIAEQKAIRHIVDFGHYQVFDGPTTYTCLLFLNGTPRREIEVATLEKAEPNHQPLPKSEGDWQRGSLLLSKLDAEAWIFALGPARALLEKLKRHPQLKKIATVFMGTGTRADSVYFMKRQGNRFYSRSLEEWVEIEDTLMHPALTGQDIDPYTYETDNYLLSPYRLVGDTLELIPPDEMASHYPKAWAYLNQPTNLQILEGRDKGAFENRADWYAYGRPQNMHLFAKEKIVGPDVAGRAEFMYDADGRYIIDTIYAIQTREGVQFSLLALTALLNSPVMTFFLQQTGTDLRGGYFRMKTAYLNPFPIPRIDFTTPPDERERLVDVGINEAAEWIESTEPFSVDSVTFSEFSDSSLGRWLDERLSGDPQPNSLAIGPEADVAHDLLAYLTKQMISLHEERQRLEKALDPFKYLNRGAPFIKLGDAFAEEIKYGELLHGPPDPAVAHHDIDGLRMVPAGDQWELQAQLKLRDPDDEWRSWQYEENGPSTGSGRGYIARRWVPVYRLEMEEAKARYYQHAFLVLDQFAEARSFPGGYTRTALKKLRLSRVPAFDAEANLAPLVELSRELATVKGQTARTDALIDQIVYRLYGLTEDEVAVVEEHGAV
jgi:hypothetical protein